MTHFHQHHEGRVLLLPSPDALACILPSLILRFRRRLWKTSPSPRKKPAKRNKKDLREVQPKEESQPTTPKLDKWGLPPPTEEDIFPSLDSSVELRPADALKEYTTLEIASLLSNHIDLQFDKLDDAARVTVLHESPPVLSIDNFLSENECQELLDLQDSDSPTQVDSATFTNSISRRTSTSWFCYYATVPTFLAKAVHQLGLTLEHMEEPQLVRYAPGQEFSWHYDEVPPPQLENGGQRLLTLLVYLNTVDSGGSTIFRDLSDGSGNTLQVAPQRGRALLFFPSFRNGVPDDRTLHRGEPTTSGEKRIVQMWVHERDYLAILPPNNLQADAQEAIGQACRHVGLEK